MHIKVHQIRIYSRRLSNLPRTNPFKLRTYWVDKKNSKMAQPFCIPVQFDLFMSISMYLAVVCLHREIWLTIFTIKVIENLLHVNSTFILKNSCVGIRKIAKYLSMSYELTEYIKVKVLGIKFVSARLGPNELTHSLPKHRGKIYSYMWYFNVESLID